MKNVKCSGCEEYKNEWCEKIIDSPHPDILRDCPHWHERKDMVEVIRCRDCKHYSPEVGSYEYAIGYCSFINSHLVMNKGFCSWAERKKS